MLISRHVHNDNILMQMPIYWWKHQAKKMLITFVQLFLDKDAKFDLQNNVSAALQNYRLFDMFPLWKVLANSTSLVLYHP